MRPLASVARFGTPVSGRLALAVLAGVGAAAAAIGLTATSAWLLSRAAQQPPVLYLMVAITGVRAFGIGRGVLRYLERLAAHDAAFRVLGELRGRVYERLERLAPAGLAAFHSGDLLERLVADVDGLADLWLRLLLPYAVAAVAGVGSVLLVGALVPAAGAALAASLLLVAIVAPLAVLAATRRSERELAPARAELAAAAVDALAAAPELLAAGAVPSRLEALSAIDARLARGEARSATGAGLGTLLSGLAGGAGTWLALVAGIVALRAGALDGVALAVVALTPIAASEVVAGLVPAAQQLPGLGASAARVTEVLAAPDPVAEPAAPVPLPAGPYGVAACGLRAAYGPDGADALGPVDFDVPAGGRALVIGPSGSGKSTLAAVLLRFLEPRGGTVRLVCPGATVDLRELAGDDVRRVVGLCAQDPHVFDTSIAENLRIARPAAGAGELRAALGSARLLDWVDSLPDGIDTLVGEHGARLSGGQRQRLSLARVLLADMPVLVLDEPTEHVDERMARELMCDAFEAAAGRTLIVMSHRPDLMPDVAWDAVVDLGAGVP